MPFLELSKQKENRKLIALYARKFTDNEHASLIKKKKLFATKKKYNF